MKNKLLSFLICCCLILPTFTACGGNDISAVSMRLQRMVGIVHLFDDKGKEKSLQEQMRLLDGDKIDTDAESLVMVSLDETKLVTMEENASADILGSGKKLVFKINEGNVFINVTEKLAEGESFDVQTSNMICGIRGTSLGTGTDAEGHEYVYATDGSFIATATDEKGNTTTAEAAPGTMLTLYKGAEADNGKLSFGKRTMTVEDLPAIALDAITKSKALKERIVEATGFDEKKIEVLAKLSSKPATTMYGQAADDFKKEGVDDSMPLMGEQAREMTASAQAARDMSNGNFEVEMAVVTGCRGVLDAGTSSGYSGASLSGLMNSARRSFKKVVDKAATDGLEGDVLTEKVNKATEELQKTAEEAVKENKTEEEIEKALDEKADELAEDKPSEEKTEEEQKPEDAAENTEGNTEGETQSESQNGSAEGAGNTGNSDTATGNSESRNAGGTGTGTTGGNAIAGQEGTSAGSGTGTTSSSRFTDAQIEALRSIFDAEYYASLYPDVVAEYGNDPDALFKHFLEHGINEGRDVNPDFNVSAYKSSYGDLQEAYGDNIADYYLHYAENGKEEGRELTTVEKATEAGIQVTDAVTGEPVNHVSDTSGGDRGGEGNPSGGSSDSSGSSSGGGYSGGSGSDDPNGNPKTKYGVSRSVTPSAASTGIQILTNAAGNTQFETDEEFTIRVLEQVSRDSSSAYILKQVKAVDSDGELEPASSSEDDALIKTYTFIYKMRSSNVSIVAEYEEVNVGYDVTVEGFQSNEGEVKHNSAGYYAGGNVSFSVRPATGYKVELNEIRIKNSNDNSAVEYSINDQPDTDGFYKGSFTMPSGPVVIYAEFDPAESYQLMLDPAYEQYITVSGITSFPASVFEGSRVSLTYNRSGYRLRVVDAIDDLEDPVDVSGYNQEDNAVSFLMPSKSIILYPEDYLAATSIAIADEYKNKVLLVGSYINPSPENFYVLTPEAAEEHCTVTSDAPDVVKVEQASMDQSDNIHFYALKAGTAKITVTTESGLSAYTTYTVKNNPVTLIDDETNRILSESDTIYVVSDFDRLVTASFETGYSYKSVLSMSDNIGAEYVNGKVKITGLEATSYAYDVYVDASKDGGTEADDVSNKFKVRVIPKEYSGLYTGVSNNITRPDGSEMSLTVSIDNALSSLIGNASYSVTLNKDNSGVWQHIINTTFADIPNLTGEMVKVESGSNTYYCPRASNMYTLTLLDSEVVSPYTVVFSKETVMIDSSGKNISMSVDFGPEGSYTTIKTVNSTVPNMTMVVDWDSNKIRFTPEGGGDYTGKGLTVRATNNGSPLRVDYDAAQGGFLVDATVFADGLTYEIEIVD